MSEHEIISLIDRMIEEWDSVHTFAAINKRDALKELKQIIIESHKEDRC